jgi:hypothetical protein
MNDETLTKSGIFGLLKAKGAQTPAYRGARNSGFSANSNQIIR